MAGVIGFGGIMRNGSQAFQRRAVPSVAKSTAPSSVPRTESRYLIDPRKEKIDAAKEIAAGLLAIGLILSPFTGPVDDKR